MESLTEFVLRGRSSCNTDYFYGRQLLAHFSRMRVEVAWLEFIVLIDIVFFQWLDMYCISCYCSQIYKEGIYKQKSQK